LLDLLTSISNRYWEDFTNLTSIILIVEDEHALQETLSDNLEHLGDITRVVGDGQSALDVTRQINPDLIVLDIMLPVIDGFDDCRILRQGMNDPVMM